MIMFAVILALALAATEARPTFDESVVAPMRRRLAATCRDGSTPGSDGCCPAATCSDTQNPCAPPCCLSSAVSSSGSGYTCTCSGTIGDSTTINAQCTNTGCSAYLASIGDTISAAGSFGGCTFCFGQNTICFPDTSSRDTCLQQTGSANGASFSVGGDGKLQCSVSGGSGGGGGGGSGDPCFPSSATVNLADGTVKRVDALKEGDAIVAATADGALTTDTVSMFSISQPEVEAPFIKLTTATDATLTLTAGHHLPVGEACCSTLKKAKELSVGETVWVIDAAKPPAATTVVALEAIKSTGLHSPVLSGGGFPIVDGVVTSFDSIDKVRLAQYGLAPLLKGCKATGTCESFRHLFLGDDDRTYVGAA